MMEISSPPNPGLRAQKWAGAALLVVLVAFFLKHALVETWGYVGFDFEIFLGAAEDLKNGRSPYSDEIFRGETPPSADEIAGAYIYPAFFARLLIPLTFLSPWTAKVIFILSTYTIVLAILFPWRSWRGFLSGGESAPAESVSRFAFVVSTIFLLAWGPVLENLRFGQSNLLALTLFALAWKALPESESKGTRELLAGGLIGLAALIKLTPFLSVPLFLAARRWRLLTGLAIGSAFGLLFSGWGANREFFFEILPAVTGLSDSPRGIDLATVLNRLLPGSVGGWVCGALVLAVAGFVHRRRREIAPRDLVLLAAFLVPVFTGLWFHHHLLALLPLALLPRRVLTNLTFGRGVALLLALAPGFADCPPVGSVLESIGRAVPLSPLELFTLGQALAFFLLLPDMIGRHERDRPPA